MRSGLRKVALLFPGQGAQHIGMAADIYRTYPAAKRIVDQCDDAIGGGLRKLMFEGPVQSLTSTEVAQPAILCHSIAMLRVLEEEHGFDIKNCLYALGHSLGEYSALVATKSISLEVALKLVRLRGLAMRTATSSKQTSMRALVINGNHLEDIEALMESIKQSLPDGEVAEISNINSRAQVVLSGTAKGVEYAGSKIQTKGFAGRSIALPVSAPFHCSLMSPAAEKMKPALDGTTFSDPIIDVISNVTGKPFNHPDEIGRLLTDQITKTVQWQRSIQYAREDGVQEWIAVGPSRVLSNLLKKEYPLDVVRCISKQTRMSSNAAVKAVEASARKVHSVMGIVVGTHMAKTIKVRTAKSRMHPVVLKPVVKHKNILAHDETESCVVGDWVRIDSCRQISKTKRYTLGDIVRPAARYVDEFGVMHSQAAPVPKPTPPRKIDNLFGTGKQ